MDSRKILNREDSWAQDEKEYDKAYENADKKFRETAKEEKKGVKDVSKEAQKRVKESEKEIKDWSKDEVKKAKDDRKTYGETAAGQLDQTKEADKLLRDRTANESKRMQERIDSREVRFEEGLDRIEQDVTTPHGRRNSETSTMDIHGNYMAADRKGTVNNYMEQIEKHSDNTKTRIADDAGQASDNMKRTADRLQRKK